MRNLPLIVLSALILFSESFATATENKPERWTGIWSGMGEIKPPDQKPFSCFFANELRVSKTKIEFSWSLVQCGSRYSRWAPRLEYVRKGKELFYKGNKIGEIGENSGYTAASRNGFEYKANFTERADGTLYSQGSHPLNGKQTEYSIVMTRVTNPREIAQLRGNFYGALGDKLNSHFGAVPEPELALLKWEDNSTSATAVSPQKFHEVQVRNHGIFPATSLKWELKTDATYSYDDEKTNRKVSKPVHTAFSIMESANSLNPCLDRLKMNTLCGVPVKFAPSSSAGGIYEQTLILKYFDGRKTKTVSTRLTAKTASLAKLKFEDLDPQRRQSKKQKVSEQRDLWVDLGQIQLGSLHDIRIRLSNKGEGTAKNVRLLSKLPAEISVDLHKQCPVELEGGKDCVAQFSLRSQTLGDFVLPISVGYHNGETDMVQKIFFVGTGKTGDIS